MKESEVSAPTDVCPHPEWWTTENGMAAEVEVSMLVAALVRATQPEFVIEIGTSEGQTAERIAKVIVENGHGEFVSLEIGVELCDVARKRCAGLPVDIVCVDSLQYMPTKRIDFLFVDGAADRRADVRHCLAHMAPHSMIVIHDSYPEVYRQHLPEIFEMCGGSHIELYTPRGLVIIKLL